MASAIGASINLDAAIDSVLAQDGYDAYRGEMVALAYTLPALTDALEGTLKVRPNQGEVILSLARLRADGRVISRTHYPSGLSLYKRAEVVGAKKGN